MKTSIIISYGNHLPYLQDCLQGIIEQNLSDIEVLLVVDQDQVLTIEEADYKTINLRILLSPKTTVGAKRNLGLAKATGNLIYFHDDDDYLYPNSLKKMISQIDDYDLVVGRRMFSWFKREVFFAMTQEKNEENNSRDRNRDREITEEDVIEVLIGSRRGLKNISCLNILLKKEFLTAHQIQFAEEMVFYPDLSFVIEIAKAAKSLKYVSEAIYIKRNHNDPINVPALSQIRDSDNKFNEFISAFEDGIKAAGDNEELKKKISLKLISYYCRYFARKLRRSKEPVWKEERFEIITNCLKRMPNSLANELSVYRKAMFKAGRKQDLKLTLRIIALHFGKQKVKKILKNKNELNKYFYYNFFLNKPVNKKIVLFETFLGKSYADSPKYIYEYLAKNYPDKYEFVWVLNDTKTQLPYEGIKIKRFTRKYAYYLAVAKYLVFNTRQPLWYRKREEQILLETWHGTPLKRLAFDQEEVTAASPTYKKQFYRQKQEWDYLIADNQFSSDIFKSCFLYDGEMLLTGYPRNDIMYYPDKEKRALDLKKKLGIPLDKKTILYAPTWRDDEYYGKGQYKFELKLDLNKMKAELGDEYVILLRTHHYIADNLDIKGNEDFAFNVSNYDDIGEIYLISDICITDYSSVFFDFANLRRPIIFYPYDIEKYRDVLRGFYIDMEKDLPGPLVYTSEEVIQTIKSIDQMVKQYADKYQIFYERFCYLDDGFASKRVVEVVFNDK